jgi:hypothetical protein
MGSHWQTWVSDRFMRIPENSLAYQDYSIIYSAPVAPPHFSIGDPGYLMFPVTLERRIHFEVHTFDRVEMKNARCNLFR